MIASTYSEHSCDVVDAKEDISSSVLGEVLVKYESKLVSLSRPLSGIRSELKLVNSSKRERFCHGAVKELTFELMS